MKTIEFNNKSFDVTPVRSTPYKVRKTQKLHDLHVMFREDPMFPLKEQNGTQFKEGDIVFIHGTYSKVGCWLLVRSSDGYKEVWDWHPDKIAHEAELSSMFV